MGAEMIYHKQFPFKMRVINIDRKFPKIWVIPKRPPQNLQNTPDLCGTNHVLMRQMLEVKCATQ